VKHNTKSNSYIWVCCISCKARRGRSIRFTCSWCRARISEGSGQRPGHRDGCEAWPVLDSLWTPLLAWELD
jgi:hypothetical protein